MPWWQTITCHGKCHSHPSSEVALTGHRVEKYRPVTLEDVVSHQDITSTSTYHTMCLRFLDQWLPPVDRFIEKNRLPHLLFYGPPGTGKTSTILAVARRIYGKDYRKQILEVPRMYHPL
jgi:replication factor C subunit 3/5